MSQARDHQAREHQAMFLVTCFQKSGFGLKRGAIFEVGVQHLALGAHLADLRRHLRSMGPGKEARMPVGCWRLDPKWFQNCCNGLIFCKDATGSPIKIISFAKLLLSSALGSLLEPGLRPQGSSLAHTAPRVPRYDAALTASETPASSLKMQ